LAGWLWNLSRLGFTKYPPISVSFTDKFKGEIVVLVSFYSAKFKVKATAPKGW